MRNKAAHAAEIPIDFCPIHIIGIGGYGMSALAALLHELGYAVQGSDKVYSLFARKLAQRGIRVHTGHEAAHLGEARLVVISTAVKPDNPEVLEARRRGIRVLHRREMLAALIENRLTVCVTGTHGKTSTTSILATLFEEAGKAPGFVCGGIMENFGVNARLGDGTWMVVEADESDNTFLELPVTVAVLTNIDPDHLAYHGTFARLRSAFEKFIGRIAFYGFGVCCIDHPEVRRLCSSAHNKRLYTYGTSKDAHYRLVDVHVKNDGTHFSIDIKGKENMPRRVSDCHIALHGIHYALNATAAFAVMAQLGFDDRRIRDGLKRYAGVRRRFTLLGDANKTTYIDDFAHHPVEIDATLNTALALCKKRVIALVQPHRFSRWQLLFDDFIKVLGRAHCVVLTPVFSCGEPPVKSVMPKAIAAALEKAGHAEVHVVESYDALAPLMKRIAAPGDYVVAMGAGDISAHTAAMFKQLCGTESKSGRISAQAPSGP